MSEEIKKAEEVKLFPEFSFIIEGMSRKQADALLDIITTFADSHQLFVGGGYILREESNDDKEM